jgi:uncharacterized protein YycO
VKYWRIRVINSAGFVSEAIDWATNSLWDHTEIGTESGTWIGAHDDGGVQERPANYCMPTRERRYAIPVTDEQYEKIMGFARREIGTPYDFADIAGLLVHDRKIDAPHRFICSAFVTAAGMAGDVNLLNVEPGFEYLITPEAVHLSPLLIGNCTYVFPEEAK